MQGLRPRSVERWLSVEALAEPHKETQVSIAYPNYLDAVTNGT